MNSSARRCPLTRSILAAAGTALWLSQSSVTQAVTSIWDGGGSSDLITTAGNWIGDVAPTSNIATTDLVFSGIIRPTPNFGTPFSAHSIAFDNGVGAFTFSGSALTIGTGGITNNDSNLDIASFTNAVTLGANGPLNLNGGVTSFSSLNMGSNVLTVTGGSTASVASLTGSNALIVNAPGFFSFSVPSAQGFDITINAGVVSNIADGVADVFNNTTAISVGGSSTLILHESLVLNGATLTRAVNSGFDIDTGKQLTLQAGAAVTSASGIALQGGSIAISGTGSVFKITNGQSAGFSSGSSLNLTSGGHFESAGSLSLAIIPGTSSVSVDGAGSLVSSGSTSNWGTLGGIANVTLGNNATGAFGGLNLAPSGTGSGANALVQSGADVTSDALALATGGNLGANATVTVTGAGSSWTVNGSQTLTIGAAANSAGVLNINTGAAFTTGTGVTMVNKAGTVSVAGGTLNLGGSLNISGSVNATSGGTLTFAPGSTVAISNGGTLATTGGLNLGNGGSLMVSITNTGSTLNAGANLSIWGNGGDVSMSFSDLATGTLGALQLASPTPASTATVNVQSGAVITSADLAIATTGVAGNNASLTVSGTGSTWSLSGNSGLSVGAATGGTGTLTLGTGAQFVSGLNIITINPTGTLSLAGGNFVANADLIVSGGKITRSGGVLSLGTNRNLTAQSDGDINLGNSDLILGGSSALTVAGAGSTFTARILEAVTSNNAITATAGGSITLSGANALRFGAGNATIDGSGSQISVITAGASHIGSGTNNANLTISSNGLATFSNGLDVPQPTSTASGGSVSLQSGGDLVVGNLNVATGNSGTAGTITISGAGSTLSQSGTATLTIGKPTGGTGSLLVSSGAAVATGTGAITVNSTGSIAISGGTFQANGDLNVAGQITRDGTGVLSFGAGKSFNLFGAATFSGNFTNFIFGSGGTLNVQGANAFFNTITSGLSIQGGSTLSVKQGADILLDAGLAIGNASPGTATIDGPGSTVSVGFDFFAGGNSTNGSTTLTNGASLTIGGSVFLSVVANSTSSLSVLSGADVTLANQLQIGTVGSSAVTVSGTGSTLSLSSGGQTTIGTFSGAPSSLSVSDSGNFTGGSGGLTLRPSGVLNITGGSLNIPGPIVDEGGSVTFTSGSLSYQGDLSVESSGLLGSNISLSSAQKLTLSGTTTINPFQTLTINGGFLSTGALVANGTLDFQKGTLAITGPGGLEIGGGALGSNATLSTGATLQIVNKLAITASSQLNVTGATVSASSLDNEGLLELFTGVLSFSGPAENKSGADLLTSRPLSITGILTNHDGGRITLLTPAGRLNGIGAFMNSGLLTGDGIIGKPFANLPGGEVRGETGKTLHFTGTSTPNAGKFTLQGGTIEFTNSFTNGPAGQITGRGTLNFAGGLNNQGAINLSGGFTDVYGDINQSGIGTVIVSGGATASFYDDFVQNGSEVRTSIGSRSVFFGKVKGAGAFTGSGETYFEGTFSPGDSPAIVTISNAVTFAPSNILTMEIGGLTAGPGNPTIDNGYDRLVFTSAANPMVTFGGALQINLINDFVPAPGQSFDLFSFDPARSTGQFSSIQLLDLLPPGVEFDYSQLYSTGQVLVVVPEPHPARLLGLGLISFLGLRRNRLSRASGPAEPTATVSP